MASLERWHEDGSELEPRTLPQDSPEAQEWLTAKRNFHEAGMRLAGADDEVLDEYHQQHAEAALKYQIMTVRLLELCQADRTGADMPAEPLEGISREAALVRKLALKINKERLEKEHDALTIMIGILDAELECMQSILRGGSPTASAVARR